MYYSSLTLEFNRKKRPLAPMYFPAVAFIQMNFTFTLRETGEKVQIPKVRSVIEASITTRERFVNRGASARSTSKTGMA